MGVKSTFCHPVIYELLLTYIIYYQISIVNYLYVAKGVIFN